jgi:DNA/RNA endonuclease YhcR with UshA esterase domain
MAIQPVLSDFLLSWVATATLLTATPNQIDKEELEPRYNPATVVDLTGRVSAVREIPRNKPLSRLHLLMSTETGEIDAYLGPVEFLKEFEMTFSAGDKVQIIGSKVSFGGRPVVLVREVRKGEIFLYLRDRIGYPNWPAETKPRT